MSQHLPATEDPAGGTPAPALSAWREAADEPNLAPEIEGSTLIMFSTNTRRTLAAVCKAILPDGESESASEDLQPVFERVEQLVSSLSDPGDKRRLMTLLTALDNPIVNLVLSGRIGRLANMDVESRQAVLRTWAHSRLGLRRAGFQALKRLANVAYYCWPQENGSHSAWTTASYPGPLPHPQKTFAPLETLPVQNDMTLECDAVVVGSGAGGGVVAGILAESGLDVVVLEKGKNLGPSDMSQVEGEMLGKSYLDGGMLMTQSGSMPILAGNCVGGGTVINYTTSFPPSDRVRAQWDEISGFELFTGRRFSESLERVSTRLNVGTEWSNPGVRDQILEKGLRELGWHVDKIPRNVTDCPEGLECGYCGYGCRHGTKNDNARTYLKDAVAANARIVESCDVNKVLIERGRATGVVGTVQGETGRVHEITVRAPVVVVACGSLHTPAVLKRSGLTNENLGRGLKLHPASAVMGVFPDPVEPWSGALQTRYSDQFADLDDGYGVKFETAPIHLALPASAFGWESALRYRQDIERLAHTSLVGMLLRDRDSGHLSFTKQGKPRVHYDISDFDAGHIHRAVTAAAELLAAAGAKEVVTLHSPPVRVTPGSAGWIDGFKEACADRGYQRNRMSFISFHQMATASMGADAKNSVVGESGQVHGVKGLHVADASAFPTSSGVNPMITIMAIADHVARVIVETK